MNCLRVPSEIRISQISAKANSLSPANFGEIYLPNAVALKELLTEAPIRGVTTPRIAFLRKAPTSLITNKALQSHSYFVNRHSSGVIPLSPRYFSNLGLKSGDILFSTNVNIGESAVVFENNLSDLTINPWMVILRPQNQWYVFAFLKHQITQDQMESFVPRGSIFRNAGGRYLNLMIPFPNQRDGERVIQYVSALMQAIVEKEKVIRDKSDLIHDVIQAELESNQRNREFQYIYPSIADLSSLQRFDAVIYDQEYKSKIWLVENYAHGSETPQQAGFTVTPGPSLEIKIIRTRIDSETYRPGYYTLILPTNISVCGTMNVLPYLGTPKSLPLLKQGDIVFGEAGFQKGRSIVLIDPWPKCTTNAHGLYARRSDGDIQKAIFFRCIFSWYRTMRLIDIMAVGGSGGHFSPEYFDYVRIPRFPDDKQVEIARLYHHDAAQPAGRPTLDSFMDWHNRWNTELGIWELDRGMKALQRTLSEVQEQIIEGKTVNVPI